MAGATKAPKAPKAPKTADGRSPEPGKPEPGGPAALAARLARLLLGPWLKPPGEPRGEGWGAGAPDAEDEPKARGASEDKGKGA